MADDNAPAEQELPSVPEPTGDDTPSTGRRRGPLFWVSGGIVAVGIAAAGFIGWTQVKPTIESRKYRNVSNEVPTAPTLDPASGEQLLRIDPTRSSLTYEIGERFAGKSTVTATGTTHGIAGDLALDEADLAKSRVGKIVVNIEQFRSDNNLRDARIRKDFLESHAYPLATFETTELTGLSGKLAKGTKADFTMAGNLTVKKTTAPVTWKVNASWDGSALTATATTTAKLSRFDAGPISIAGLVTTDDEIDLTLKLTAVDPGTTTIATSVDTDEKEASTKGAPSFAKEVAPILEQNCALCHNTGQMAADSVRLDTAGDAAAISDGIKTVTQTGYMPPWPASDVGVPLNHVAKLSKAELDTLAKWSDAGGPLDVPASSKVTMTAENAALLPRKDKTLLIPSYTGSVENRNDYRCFVLDPKLTEPTFMTGYTFETDNVRQIHHVQVFQISKQQVASSASVDGKDGESGWECYAGPNLQGERPSKRDFSGGPRDVGFAGQSDLVGGWVPGQTPVIFSENSGILLQPGDALVIQIHYHFASDPVPDTSGLSLQLDSPSSGVKKLRIVNPLGPVEIPCNPADEGAPLCDRDAALAENVRLYGPSGAANEAGLLMLCGQTPDKLTAGFDGNVARSSCLLKVPQDGTIVGVTGHMHTIGKSIRLTLDPGEADEKILLDIPDWSFDWQMNYELATPLKVTAGQTVKLDCAWDRRKAPGREPKYIVFAEGTEDEMCFATYALIPDRQD
jgi:polyisoprenoid-binding protein YceI